MGHDFRSKLTVSWRVSPVFRLKVVHGKLHGDITHVLSYHSSLLYMLLLLLVVVVVVFTFFQSHTSLFDWTQHIHYHSLLICDHMWSPISPVAQWTPIWHTHCCRTTSPWTDCGVFFRHVRCGAWVQRISKQSIRAKLPTCIMLVKYSGKGITLHLGARVLAEADPLNPHMKGFTMGLSQFSTDPHRSPHVHAL